MRTVLVVLVALPVVLAPVGLVSPGTAAPPPVTCRGEVATLVGTAGRDVLEGTPARDVIAGLDGNDRIRGGEGDDLICGGDGADRLFGDEGDDVLLAGRALLVDNRAGSGYRPDGLDGGPGDDLLDIGKEPTDLAGNISGEVRFGSAAGGVLVDLAGGTATGDGADTIVPRGGLRVIGTADGDVLQGSDFPEELLGMAGADRIEGRGGDDRLFGDPEGALEGPAGAEDDVLAGGRGKDVLIGASGSDRLVGGLGVDLLEGHGLGAQQVLGGAGADFLYLFVNPTSGMVASGGEGRDDVTVEVPPTAKGTGRQVTVDLRDGTIWVPWGQPGEASGIERLHAGERVTALHVIGTSGPDEVYAGPRSRLAVRTGGGDDVVWGSRRDDHIDAGSGRDEVRGGPGDDTCLRAKSPVGCETTG